MSGRAPRRSSTARRAGKGRWPAGAKSDGRFGKQDFAYLPKEDVYRCPAGERLPYRYTNEEAGKVLRRYWTTACPKCSLKSQCTTGPEPRITRWEHEHLLEAVPQRLDANPRAMRQRRETVEHPFGTIKARMGATHFLTKTLPKVAAEMALSVLAYNLARAMNIVGVKPLLAVFCRKDQHFIRIGIRSTATTQPKRPRACLWKQHLVCA